MKRSRWLYAACSLVAAIGCQGSSDSSPEAHATAPTATAQATSAGPTTVTAEPHAAGAVSPAALSQAEPSEAVAAFLSHLQAGRSQQATALITTKAQLAMEEHGMSISPVGSPTSQYRVGRTEFVTPAKDGAWVSSIWSEQGVEGDADEFEIVWILRHEGHGWRIVGMASEVIKGEAPLFLDFENPAEMQLRLSEAEEAIAAASEAQPNELRQAQNPAAEGNFRPR